MRLFSLVLSSLIFLGAVVWVRSQTVQEILRCTHAKKREEKLRQELQNLKAEWLRETSVPYLRKLAPALGLRAPLFDPADAEPKVSTQEPPPKARRT